MKKRNVISILLLSGLFLVTGCSGPDNFINADQRAEGEMEGESEDEAEEQVVAEEIEIGKSYTIDEKANIEIVKIKTTEVVLPLLGNRNINYMKTVGEKKLDVALSVENISEEVLAVDELIQVSATDLTKDIEYVCDNYKIEIADNTELSAEEKVNPGEIVRLHCEMSVKESSKEYQIYFGENKEYQVEFNAEKEISVSDDFPEDSNIMIEDFAEITLNDVYFSTILEPENPSGVYQYIDPQKDGEVLLIAEFAVTNLSGAEKQIDDILILCTYFEGLDVSDESEESEEPKGKKEYFFQSVADKKEGKDLEISYSGSPKIEAGETRKIFCVISVPEAAQSEDIELYIATKDVEFTKKVVIDIDK